MKPTRYQKNESVKVFSFDINAKKIWDEPVTIRFDYPDEPYGNYDNSFNYRYKSEVFPYFRSDGGLWIISYRYRQSNSGGITKASLYLISGDGDLITGEDGLELDSIFKEEKVTKVVGKTDGQNGLWLVWNPPYPKVTHINSAGSIDSPQWDVKGRKITDIKGSVIEYNSLSIFSDGSLIIPYKKDGYFLQKVGIHD